MPKMSRGEVERQFRSALDALYERDSRLLMVGSSERSVTHRLAVHLEGAFPDYDVDCEYNRVGPDGNAKRLLASPPRAVRPDDLDAVTVFPDIVVHERGNDENNLLVIEAKKDAGSASQLYQENSAWDRVKLLAYKEQLKYQFAIFLTVPVGPDSFGQPQIEFIE